MDENVRVSVPAPASSRCILIEPMRFRAGLPPSVALLLLSALWAIGWLLPDLLPHSGAKSVPLPMGQAILFTGFAAITSLTVAARKLKYPRGRCAWACAAVGVGLFVVPTVVAAIAQQWISNFDEVAALCLTPVFAVILEPYLQDGPPSPARAALPATLAAIAGVLALIPLDAPGSFQAGAALFAMVATAFAIAAANCVAVKLARTPQMPSILPMGAMASGSSAVCFAAIFFFSRSEIWSSSPLEIYVLRLLLVDLPCLFLLFRTMRGLAASRMTARFLLAPLFAAVAGLAVAQTGLAVRGITGMLLLAAGAGWLAFAPAAREEQGSIRIKEIPT